MLRSELNCVPIVPEEPSGAQLHVNLFVRRSLSDDSERCECVLSFRASDGARSDENDVKKTVLCRALAAFSLS